MRPTFTLLIHARGRPDMLAATLASLRFTLTRDDVECVALAERGRASAEIAALLRAEPGIGRVLTPHRPCDVVEARAALLERARGRIAVMLTTPARLTDSAWLDRLLRALAHESVGMAGPFGASIDAGWQGMTPLGAGKCDVLSGGPWALRRDVLLAGAALDPLDGYGVWPDAEQALRVRELGYVVRCTGEIGAGEVCPHSPDAAAWPVLRARWAGRGLIGAEMVPHSPDPSIPQGERGVGTRHASSAIQTPFKHPDARGKRWGVDFLPRRKRAG